jgi:hypothetical protein
VSIEFGYQHFPPGTDEDEQLTRILDDAFEDGLIFLAGQDAGAGSAAPLANVWDNGKDPVDELNRVLRVRAKALQTFNEERIPEGLPLATLEEVLVPVYLFHRYQVEAAASVLGGLYYHHKLRGDVQEYPSIVPGDEQRRALRALLETISPDHLIIPEDLLRLIPPRPPGFYQTREMFSGYTGDTFDPLAAAESAARVTVERILHPYRASRLVEYHARDSYVPGLTEVLIALLDASWRRRHDVPMKSEIQRVIDRLILDSMMRLSVDDRASGQVRAEVFTVLTDLKKWLDKQKKSEKEMSQRAHFMAASAQLAAFFSESYAEFSPRPIATPPGAPIGTGVPKHVEIE